MSEWRSLVREHLLAMQTRNYAVGTLESAARYLKMWLAWCEGDGPRTPTEATAAHLDAFADGLKQTVGVKGHVLGGATVDRAMQVVRNLFRWAAKREVLLFDPAAELVLSRASSALPSTPTLHDVEQLLAKADDGTLLGMRDRAVVETFYGTGIRKTELMRLDVNDLDLKHGKLRVQGKGRVERFVPVGESLAETLQRYLVEGRPRMVGRTGETALFVSYQGERYSGSGLAGLLERVGKRAGLHLSAHMLRHAYAVHLLQCGADLEEVQKLLGHRRITSTQIYTQISNAVFSRKFRRCHPRGGRITRGDV